MELINERKEQLKKHLNQLITKQEALQIIIDIVEDVTGADVKARSKKRENADARIIYSALASKYIKTSTLVIGSMISRDHSTVLHHRKKAVEYIEFDPSFRKMMNEAEERLLTDNESSLIEKQIEFHKGKVKKYMDLLWKAS